MTEKEEESELIEKLAEFKHNHSCDWLLEEQYRKNHSHIKLIEYRTSLQIPYADLSEEMKEEDRKWARKVLEIIKEHPRFCLAVALVGEYVLTDEERERAKDISNVFR